MNRQTTGFTLIEMMISIVLGIIIIFGIGQIFVATRTSFSAQQGLSHVQQSGRFAMEFIGSAVRSTGDMAYNNVSSLMRGEATPATAPTSDTVAKLYQITDSAAAGADVAAAIDFSVPLQVYEWNGSAPGDTVDYTSLSGTAPDNWTPSLPEFVADRALPGSDVVITRYVESRSFQADAVSGGETAIAGFELQRFCGAAGDGLEIGMSTFSGANGVPSADDEDYLNLIAAKPRRLIAIGQNDLVLIAQATVFSNNPLVFRTFGAVGFPGNYTDPARMCGPFGQTPPIRTARAGMARVDIFYVGQNATTGDPGLWRLSFDGSDGIPFIAEELVEGVENMQVLLGITKPVGTKNSSNRPDEYVTAAQLTDPAALGLPDGNAGSAARRTLTSRISLLVRSEDGAAGAANDLTYQLAGTTIDPIDDRRVRQVYEQTLAVRNRARLLNGAADSY